MMTSSDRANAVRRAVLDVARANGAEITDHDVRPLFLTARRPVPARQPAPRNTCPHTGRR